MAAGQVRVAVGEAPDPSCLREATSAEVPGWGGRLSNQQTLATGGTGTFAAGDVTYGPRPISNAAAHGRLAARSIHAYLQHLSRSQIAELPEDELQTASTLPAGGIVHLDLRPTPREEMPLRTSEAAHDRAVEFAAGFRPEQARREAGRCLRCGLAYLPPAVKLRGPPRKAAPQRSPDPVGERA